MGEHPKAWTVQQKSSWKCGLWKKLIQQIWNLPTPKPSPEKSIPNWMESSAQKLLPPLLPHSSSCLLALNPIPEIHTSSAQTLGSRPKIPWKNSLELGNHSSRGDRLIEPLSWRPLLDPKETREVREAWCSACRVILMAEII